MSNITMSNTDPGEGSALANDNFVAVYGGKSLLDIFYPVGSYYETSDANFDPNTSWGGEWVEDTGHFTVSRNSGTFDTIGATGGNENHHHRPNDMVALIGSAQGNADSLGFVASNSGSLDGSTYSVSGTGHFAPGHPNRSHNTALEGTTDDRSNLPPYVVVVRWHRIA